MTEAQQIQYDRFLAIGFAAEDARLLVERGAWLGSLTMTARELADARRYRAERDARTNMEAHPKW